MHIAADLREFKTVFTDRSGGHALRTASFPQPQITVRTQPKPPSSVSINMVLAMIEQIVQPVHLPAQLDGCLDASSAEVVHRKDAGLFSVAAVGKDRRIARCQPFAFGHAEFR